MGACRPEARNSGTAMPPTPEQQAEIAAGEQHGRKRQPEQAAQRGEPNHVSALNVVSSTPRAAIAALTRGLISAANSSA